jgi:branched-chain amino acid transport system substrate-binding protein
MTITRSFLIVGLTLLAVAPVAAQVSGDTVKIGVLTDASGVYADLAGEGARVATQMAVDEFGGKVLGKPIQVLYADHQNKADIAAGIARQWYDQDKVAMILDLTNSGAALAVQQVAKEKNRIDIVTGAGASDLTGPACSPTGIHYVYDTYALAVGTGGAMVKEGGDSWFFLTADYAFGAALERDTGAAVTAAGGKVLGAVKHPLGNTDYSSFLLQAQASGAKVVGLANAGQDTVQAIKQASEFGLTQGGKQRLAGLLMFISDVHALGLQAAQGLILTTGYYWDRTDESRAFAKRFYAKTQRMPTMVQAGDYSATLHYLNAIKAANSDEAAPVMAKMKATPINDAFVKNGKIRDDGRMVYDMYLAQVKTPAESKAPWDYYKILQTIPGDQAYRPIDKGECPLVKKG